MLILLLRTHAVDSVFMRSFFTYRLRSLSLAPVTTSIDHGLETQLRKRRVPIFSNCYSLISRYQVGD